MNTVTHMSWEDFAGLILWTEDHPRSPEELLEELTDYLREQGVADGELLEVPAIRGSHLRIILSKCWEECLESEQAMIERYRDRDQL